MNDLAHSRQLDSMTGKEFEEIITQLVCKLGFKIEFQSTGPDGGIDILAKSEADLVSGYYVIQCKRYSNKVGVGAVRDLFGVVTDRRANKGILITNAEFTQAAVEFANNKPIELIGGRELSVLLERHLGKMFQTNGVGTTLPPSVVTFAKFTVKNFSRLKEMIDDQQVQIDKQLILIKPRVFSSIEEESAFFAQHWGNFKRAYQVFINQIEHFKHFLNNSTNENREKAEKGFVLIEKSLKELLRLQLEAHSAQPLGDEMFDQAFKQLKIIYSTFFKTFSDSWSNLINEIHESLDSPEKFITGVVVEGERCSEVRIVSETDLTHVSKEVKKLEHIFIPTKIEHIFFPTKEIKAKDLLRSLIKPISDEDIQNKEKIVLILSLT